MGVSGATLGLCLVAYDLAVKEKADSVKSSQDRKANEKVKLSEADALILNAGMGHGVAVPNNMYANHAKLQQIHNDLLQHRCPLEKIERWATYDDVKTDEPTKKEALAFNIGGVNAVFQVGETEEAIVKRVAIRVTTP